jgi:hypothetical protein
MRVVIKNEGRKEWEISGRTPRGILVLTDPDTGQQRTIWEGLTLPAYAGTGADSGATGSPGQGQG